MVEQLKERMSNGINFDPRFTLVGILLLASVVTLAVVVYLWRDSGAYRPLYGSGENYNAAEVIEILDTEGVSYRLHPQSGQVLVHADQLPNARMILSAKGIKAAVPAGYELFDVERPLGSSQFEQDVRLKRSLEGELARTIMTISGVAHARVHLALQEKSTFIIAKLDPAKASVALQLQSGRTLRPEQVSAIINLVANSVPQLDPKDVSVVDQNGTLISRGLTDSSGSLHSMAIVNDYQTAAVAQIEEVLAPVLGMGNFRISVAADMDLSQREETFQTYGGEPRLRSEIVRDKNVIDELALGIPGSLSNTPPANQKNTKGNTDDKNTATSFSKESNRQLQYDQTVTHVKHAPYALRRQSIAVVLNADVAPAGGWSDADRNQLEAMVRSAVGFDQQRGDLVTLSIFPFTTTPMVVEPTVWWESNQVYQLARIGIIGFMTLLLLLLVVLPVVRKLLKPTLPQTEVTQPALEKQPEEQSVIEPQPLARPTLLTETGPLSEIRLPSPDSGLELQVEHLQMLSRQDPERVSEVIKTWIDRNETKLSATS